MVADLPQLPSEAQQLSPDLNEEINSYLQTGDLYSLSNCLIINEDYEKLNDENIHNLTLFCYQSLIEI